jgi:hypothetical protein
MIGCFPVIEYHALFPLFLHILFRLLKSAKVFKKMLLRFRKGSVARDKSQMSIFIRDNSASEYSLSDHAFHRIAK